LQRGIAAQRQQFRCISTLALPCLSHLPALFLQPHVEAATIYGLRRQALLVFLPKYHLKVCLLCLPLHAHSVPLLRMHAIRLASPLLLLCHRLVGAPSASAARPSHTFSRLACMQGVIHLTDKQGLCKPPLRQAGDEEVQADDPFVLAYRRSLAVVGSGGGDSEGASPASAQGLIRPSARCWTCW
jgi:hypothetical protein